MTDPIRVRFLGEEREFVPAGEGVYRCKAIEATLWLKNCFTHAEWTLRFANHEVTDCTPQGAASSLEDELRPLAKALTVLSADKRGPAPIREAIDAISRTIDILDDGCHDSALNELFRAREALSADVRKTDPLSRIELATRDLSEAISDDGLPNESERLLLKAITLVREAHRIARIAFEHGYVGKRNDFSDLGIDVEAEDDDELPDRALPAGLFEPLDDGDGGPIKRNPWEMLRQIDAALEPALSLVGDPDHQIVSHDDTLPEAFLIVCESVSKAHSVLCLTGEEMDALEHDTLPPPDEKTEPMAAPFAVTATGALKR